jgi:hypothetical protein
MRADIEDDLRRYLTEDKEKREKREQDHVAALDRIFRQFQLHEQKDELTHKDYDKRLNRLEGKDEISSSHDIDSLNKQLDARNAFNADVWKIVLTAIISVIVGAGSIKLFGK